MPVYSVRRRFLTNKHVPVGGVGNAEKMRWHFGPTLALVLLDDISRVDGQTTVGVDDDAEQSRVSLKKKTSHMQWR